MRITKHPSKPSEIKFLQDEQSLYSCDMRAIGESMDYDIPAMWKYENIIPWILDGKNAIVNDQNDINYANKNILAQIPRGNDSKISIYERSTEHVFPKLINSLWVAIPHPDADEMAKNRNYSLNYAYSDFIKRNDKFRQKELLQESTPAWHKILSGEELESLTTEYSTGYIKRRYGAGGFTVFKIEELSKNTKFQELFNENPDQWFFEECVDGRSCSAQFFKYSDDDEVILFGITEQIIAEEKYFTGSKIKALESLDKNIFKQLQKAVNNLKPVLNNYEGFFGLDFIVSGDKAIILEANIRITAATIPTLLTNQTGGGESLFKEDVEKDAESIKNNAIVLTVDQANNSIDTLELNAKNSALGLSLTFELPNCKRLPGSLDEKFVQELKSIIDHDVSKSTNISLKNFWPFGWTVCFILEESHCVISSWFLEKRILFDIFSCNVSIDSEHIATSFLKFFESDTAKNIKIENR
jgi:S-adenosylmethionine/arginine decarboxylase-like enzyme